MSEPAAETARTAPMALVAVAEAFLATLVALFGTPADVARTDGLMPKAHKLLASWLRCAEAMVRRLIAIEAAALPRANPRPARAPRKRARKLCYFYPDQPEGWRVSFPMMARRRRARGASRRYARRRFHDAWPLALRYEALIRALNAPAAYAARFARRLHANPDRLGEPLRAPPEAVHRIDHFEALGAHAQTAWRAHFSSA